MHEDIGQHRLEEAQGTFKDENTSEAFPFSSNTASANITFLPSLTTNGIFLIKNGIFHIYTISNLASI